MTGSGTELPRVCLLAAAETSPSVLYGLFDVLSTVGAIYPEMEQRTGSLRRIG